MTGEARDPIDEAHERLRAWTEGLTDAGRATHAPPSPSPAKGVSLYLLEILHAPPVKTVRKPRLHATLRYLVSAWTDPVEDGHRWLARMLQSAVQTEGFEVESAAPPLDLWRALGVPPRPGFVLRLPLWMELEAPRVSLVKRELRLEVAPLRPLQGRVTAPGDLPLAGALVEMPSLRLATRTDADGRFAFGAVPADREAHDVRVVAKGREFALEEVRPTAEGTLLIELTNMED